MKVAVMQLYKNTGDVNRYTFMLPAGYIWLDPLDITSITDPGLGLDQYPVRVLKIEKDDKLKPGSLLVAMLWACAPDNYFTQPSIYLEAGRIPGASTAERCQRAGYFRTASGHIARYGPGLDCDQQHVGELWRLRRLGVLRWRRLLYARRSMLRIKPAGPFNVSASGARGGSRLVKYALDRHQRLRNRRP